MFKCFSKHFWSVFAFLLIRTFFALPDMIHRSMISMITAKCVFPLRCDEDNEFGSVFLGGSVRTIWKAKRISGVIKAIFAKFKKRHFISINTEKLPRWHPMQESSSRFQFSRNDA